MRQKLKFELVACVSEKVYLLYANAGSICFKARLLSGRYVLLLHKDMVDRGACQTLVFGACYCDKCAACQEVELDFCSKSAPHQRILRTAVEKWLVPKGPYVQRLHLRCLSLSCSDQHRAHE